jgi:hypothetical protein
VYAASSNAAWTAPSVSSTRRFQVYDELVPSSSWTTTRSERASVRSTTGLARLVLDVDRLDGVVGDRVAVGQHHGHAVAHVVDGVDRERVVGWVQHVLGDRPGARHRCGPGVGEVGAGVHGAHAGHRRGGAGVDGDDSGARVRAAQHGHVERPGHLHVVGEDRFAGEEDGVLLAEQALADDAGGGRFVGDGHVWTPHPVGVQFGVPVRQARMRRPGRT